MDKHSHFSAFLDGEIPERYSQKYQELWRNHPDFHGFKKMKEEVSLFLTSEPEPDFDRKRDQVFEKIQQQIKQRKIKIRSKTWISRPVKLAWAAAAVFFALIGGLFLGRTWVSMEVAQQKSEEVITFQLPEGFELSSAGNPEFIQLSSFRRRPWEFDFHIFLSWSLLVPWCTDRKSKIIEWTC